MLAVDFAIHHPRKPNAELKLTFPDLPITENLDHIAELIQLNQVIVVIGETGSGKTTQLPKICLKLGRGIDKQIVHTQPRRLAARSVSERIAKELGSRLGDLVGYQVRFDRTESQDTVIKVVTDGILLAEFRDDSLLSRYDTIIIDEAHERSLNIDFLLGILVQLLPKRPDLKVIITSATINYEKFSEHFQNAPLVKVSGRTYPVEIRYQPLDNRDSNKFDGMQLARSVEQALKDLRALDKKGNRITGDILVFLPGEREIRDVSKYLRRAAIERLDVLPLYARLGAENQNRIFNPSSNGLQRIILATNVAETSLTVPGIRYVIDSGLVRISRYSANSRIQRLPIEQISQASADQRAGRCGRTEPGIAVRLYEQSNYAARNTFTDPEIVRTNLAAVVLQFLDLNLGDPLQFPFVDSPEPKLVKDGLSQLKELNLVSSAGRLTTLGKEIARFPLDPRIGSILFHARDLNVFWEVSIVAAVLVLQDPREPDFAIEEVNDVDSQFITLLNLWQLIEKQRAHLSNFQFRTWCASVALNYARIREWREIHRQILLCFPKVKHHSVSRDFNRKGFHVAFLTGLYSNIGRREVHDYQGIRNRRFRIGRDSIKGKPEWVLAAELVETHRMMARIVAKIEPQWVIDAVPKLLKHSFDKPHWSKKQGRALCYRTTRLYGLKLKDGERVSYQTIDPSEARRLFMQEAMVHGVTKSRLSIFPHNRRVFESSRVLEAKFRRLDITLGSEDMVGWFEKKIPKDIYNVSSFEKWWRNAPTGQKQDLFLTQQDLLMNPKDAPDESLFPESVSLGHLTLPAEYKFVPGKKEDGISVKVPISALMQLDEGLSEWIVPGLIPEKAEAMVRGLPKSIRRQLVPIPNFVKEALTFIDPAKETLSQGLSRLIRKQIGFVIDKDAWLDIDIDQRLRLRVEVTDELGSVIDSDRDISALKRRLSDQIPVTAKPQCSKIIKWLPDLNFKEKTFLELSGIKIYSYPRLVLSDNGVESQELLDPVSAMVNHTDAVAELLVKECSDLFRMLEAKEAIYQKALVATCGSRTDGAIWRRMLVQSAIDQPLGHVITYAEFKKIRNQLRSRLIVHTVELSESLIQCHSRTRSLKKRLQNNIPKAYVKNIEAIRAHLTLLTDNILETTPPAYLKHLNRYVQGIETRLDKLSSRLLLDAKWQKEVDILWHALKRNWSSLPNGWRYQDLELVDFRWKIEEFRLLCFAQILKIAEKVSFNRLQQSLKDYREI